MVRKPDIQYIQQFYVHGSEAKAVEMKPAKKKPKTKLPKPKPVVEQCTKIYIDPVAACGLLVAAVMLVVMAVGMIRLGTVNAEANRLEEHVAQLREENTQLHSEYKAGYDLAQIRDQALDLGLVPESQVEHVTIKVVPPQAVQEPSAWESFWTSVAEMFA